MSREILHRLDAGILVADLKTRRVGRRITLFDEIESTNSYVLSQAHDPRVAPDGWVVIAEHQSAGRGRLGRRWHSPRGASFMMTLLLHESSDRLSTARVVLATAVALVDAISQACDVEAMIHWPNDLYVGRRKLAGILVETRTPPNRTEGTAAESRQREEARPGRRQAPPQSPPGAGSAVPPQAMAIGIGVNCLQQPAHFPPDLRDRATSLEIESPHAVDRLRVATTILHRLDQVFAEPDQLLDAELTHQWRQRSGDINSRATFLAAGQEYTGRIVDVDPHAALLVQLDSGPLHRFDPHTTTRL